MENEFKISDLHSGYLVEFRNGRRAIVARAGTFTKILVDPATKEWWYLNSGWQDKTLKARIALARAFGKNPFPKTADVEKPSGEKPEEKIDVIYHPTLGRGRWVKAGNGKNGKNGKPGDWILIDMAWAPAGYKTGDILVIYEPRDRGCLAIVPDSGVRYIAGYEYSIWVPEEPEQKAPTKEEPKPMEPSFQVGDIVRTGEHPFVSSCRNCIAKVTAVRSSENCIIYTLSVRESTGVLAVQSCVRYRNRPVPLTLLWREEK